jgi:hypothetical protein
MNCSECAPYDLQRLIRSPGELSKVIKTVREAVLSGALFADAHPGHPFLDLDPDGPWQDVISYGFRCKSCARGFELQCETYHGAGGAWAPAES